MITSFLSCAFSPNCVTEGWIFPYPYYFNILGTSESILIIVMLLIYKIPSLKTEENIFKATTLPIVLMGFPIQSDGQWCILMQRGS